MTSTERTRQAAYEEFEKHVQQAQALQGDSEVSQCYQGEGSLYQGPAVLVRNTFLDIDDRLAPEPNTLRRSKTAPPGRSGSGVQDRAVEEEEEPEGGTGGFEDEEEEEEEADEAPGILPSEACQAAVEDVAPEAHELGRTTTVDWYEQPEEWNWGGQPDMMCGDGSAMALGSALPAPLPVPGQQGQSVMTMGTGGSMLPQAVPMYMSPVQGMPMVMPMIIPVGGDGAMMMPQGLEVRQPDRGARWPTPAESASMQSQATAGAGPGTMPIAGQVTVESYQTGPSAAMPPNISGVSDASQVAVAPQPHTLTRDLSVSSGNHRIHWTVDARKLRGNDKQAVSPPFELSFGAGFPSVIFKMMIYPKVVSDSKGGASFKKAKGHGFVQLKCEAELQESVANVDWRISIGSGERLQAPRGPVTHNFALSAVSRLAREQEEWNFNEAVDPESSTFVVCLEIIPRI
mmetsp:Transcript_87962/g.247144  ORF Transcript_87962/g.247144 Transcript_87962/m.247144 type:complete len:458 (-) Transcript_87962:88-1461(-)